MGLNFYYYDGLQPKMRAGMIKLHECTSAPGHHQNPNPGAALDVTDNLSAGGVSSTQLLHKKTLHFIKLYQWCLFMINHSSN